MESTAVSAVERSPDETGVESAEDNVGITVDSASESGEDSDSSAPTRESNLTLSAVPSEISTGGNPPVFGSVAVTNSSDVHFGNKTVINGPVTIKQLVGTGLGIDNGAFLGSEEDYPNAQGKTHNGAYKGRQTIQNEHSKWVIRPQFILIGLFGIAVIASVTTLVTIFLDRSQDDGFATPLDPSAELLPNSKLRYVTRTDWIAQPTVEPLDRLALPARWVIIAHTASENCSIQSHCVLVVRSIQMYHVESRRWSDIGYNFLVGGDGSAYIGRGWDYVGAHTKYYNNRSIGIAFIGTFNNVDPPKRQVAACRQLIADGVALGKIAKDYKLFGHRQLMSSLSPGDRVYSIIQKWPHWTQNNSDDEI